MASPTAPQPDHESENESRDLVGLKLQLEVEKLQQETRVLKRRIKPEYMAPILTFTGLLITSGVAYWNSEYRIQAKENEKKAENARISMERYQAEGEKIKAALADANSKLSGLQKKDADLQAKYDGLNSSYSRVKQGLLVASSQSKKAAERVGSVGRSGEAERVRRTLEQVSQQAKTAATAEQVVFHGIVVDQIGKPIPNAQVTQHLMRPPGVVGNLRDGYFDERGDSFRTDTNGQFRFAAFKTRVIRLSIEAQSCERYPAGLMVTPAIPFDRPDLGTFTLKCQTSAPQISTQQDRVVFHGIVVDQNGNPIENAEVSEFLQRPRT